jgi:predicted DsbA family dithiol-disulfide isomerase
VRGATTPTVTVWSDIGCPWATLALHTLHAAAEQRGQGLLIDHRAYPLELFNQQPTPRHIVEAEIVVIAARRPEVGWRQWAGPETHYPVTTLPALEAVQAAKAPAIGGLRASDELDTALRRAFFAESRCISIHPEILDIAARCPHVDAQALETALARGDGRSQVYEHWKAAQGAEIQGSPHVFAPGGFARHNPGAALSWTGDGAGRGWPRLDGYSPAWADEVLDAVRAEQP